MTLTNVMLSFSRQVRYKSFDFKLFHSVMILPIKYLCDCIDIWVNNIMKTVQAYLPRYYGSWSACAS